MPIQESGLRSTVGFFPVRRQFTDTQQRDANGVEIMATEHSPLPWADGFLQMTNTGYRGVSILDSNGKRIGLVDERRDAVRLVQAMNCHEELVAALEACLKVLVLHYGYANPQDEDSPVINNVRAALAKAKE